MSRENNLQKLIANHVRRKQKLQEQAALYGRSTDPGVLIEIEDIQAEIENLQTELNAVEGKHKSKVALREAPENSPISKLGYREFDTKLFDTIQKLIVHSFSVFDLVREQIISDPLFIQGPIFDVTDGINEEDLVFRIGEDGIVRFGAYYVSILQLTPRFLVLYNCDYSVTRDMVLNEDDIEFRYSDIVSVSTQKNCFHINFSKMKNHCKFMN